MQRTLSVCILFLLLICIACHNKPAPQPPGAVFGQQWYKRYTGTVAGQPVVVNLYFYGADDSREGLALVGGSYYYTNKSEILMLSEETVEGDMVKMSEFPETQRDNDEKAKYAQWVLHISDTGATGQWTSADRKKTFAIALKENYDGAYAFGIVHMRDSVAVKIRKDNAGMMAEYNMLTPAGGIANEDATFITGAVIHELGGDTLGAHDMHSYMAAAIKKDFAAYRQSIKEDSDIDDGAAARYNWEINTNATCDYNANGMVVLNLSTYADMGGAHGNYRAQYICLDVQGHKTLHLADIVTPDTARLTALLDAAVRKSFRIKPGAPLTDNLLVDTMPLPRNFTVSDKGITAHYSPYEVASFVDGEVSLFLPYTALADLLTPWFRKRMHL